MGYNAIFVYRRMRLRITSYAKYAMSLALPCNIAARTNRIDLLCALLERLPGPVTYHVFDGRFTPHSIVQSEFGDAAARVADCSIAYVLDSSRGGLCEPIAGFVANETLGIAKLQYLIDDRPPAVSANIPRRTMEMLGVYIRSLFADFQWLETVSVPSNVRLLDGLFQLTVESGDISNITLKDLKHRPQSARRWA